MRRNQVREQLNWKSENDTRVPTIRTEIRVEGLGRRWCEDVTDR